MSFAARLHKESDASAEIIADIKIYTQLGRNV